MASASASPLTVFLFGDYTDPWLDPVDDIYKTAGTLPWLRSFLDDVTSVVKNEIKCMDYTLAESIGGFNIESLQETAEMYRDAPEEYGLAQCIMGFIMRAVPLLQWVKQYPDGLSLKNERQPEAIGISGGAINAAVLAVAYDFTSLYEACLVGIGVVCRLCKFAWIRSRAVEETVGVWGRLVMGMVPDELDKILDHFQDNMGVPGSNRVRVGVRGDKWSTVVGPPSTLKLCLDQCPALRNLPTKELPIRSLQHNCPTTYEDQEFIAGQSDFHTRAVRPGFRLWGLEKPCATYDNWGHLLRVVVDQTFSSPLDLVRSAEALSAGLATEAKSGVNIDFHLMGPSCHEAYFVGVLKSGRHVSVVKEKGNRNGHVAEASHRIAIVGMGGRGPGSTGDSGTDALEHYWDVILTGRDLVSEIPSGRFDAPHLFETQDMSREHQEPDNCLSKTKTGCFLDNPGHFDARFFSISPREALLMDPGSRLFQMAAAEALQMAGYSCGRTRTTHPSKIAVFYGQSNDDGYVTAHHEKGCDAYTLQAAERAFVPGRVAFHHGWEGPTWAIDCACSTSSSLIHSACASLLVRDIDMAVAGAANVMAFPHGFCGMSKSGCLSATGNCKTFRDDADGYCRGEFVGAVVLKRLEDAIAHNDNILAVIAGSARNQSGNAKFITTSDVGAQERLFRKVLRDTHLDPSDISYVEMHGTGTPVGDPCEMTAVANVLGRKRAGEEPLTVGAVKANVGHSEAASGMSSLFKCILMYQKGVIPPQAGMPHTLNPSFPSLDKQNIRILSEQSEFRFSAEKPKRILLNNFDAAGGNACLLLEEPVVAVHQDQAKNEFVDPRSAGVVVTSAKSQKSHRANQRRLLEWLHTNPHVNLRDIAYSTTARNVHHPIRFACAVFSVQELIAELESDLESESFATKPPTAPVQKPPVVFVFTGQGSHYAGMGGELYHTNSIVRETVDMCARIGREHNFPPFVDIITDEATPDISQKDTVQIQLATLTLEIALATFWRRAGVEPSLVIGHSLGEYAALYVAGVLSISDAIYLVGQRARLLLQMCEPGTCAMLAISASAATVKQHFESMALDRRACAVACVNSPNATVVSGPVNDVVDFEAAMSVNGIRSKMLAIPFGFHSFQVEPVLRDFKALATGVTYSRPRIPVASTLLSSVVDSSGVFNPEYFAQQARQPVNFFGALQAVQKKLHNPVWLEIGPALVCGAFVRATLPTQSLSSGILSTLEMTISPWTSVARCLASLYKSGVDVDWLGLHQPYEKGLKLVALPSYAWDLKDYWLVYSEKKRDLAPEKTLGKDNEKWYTCAQWLESKSADSVTFNASLADAGFKALMEGHQMRGVAICPGSVCCEAALAAAKHALESQGLYSNLESIDLALYNTVLKRPLTTTLVGSEGTLIIKAIVESDCSVSVTFRASSQGQNTSYDLGSCIATVHDTMALQRSWNRISYYIKVRMEEVIRLAKEGCGHRLQSGIFYQLFSRTVDYKTEAYKCIREAFVSQDFEEAVAEVVLHEHPQGSRFVASPYWAESLAHLAGFLVNHQPNRPSASTTTMMMDSFGSSEQTAAFQPGRPYFTYARVCKREGNTVECEVTVFDNEIGMVMQCAGLKFHQVNNSFLDTLRPGDGSRATNTAAPFPKTGHRPTAKDNNTSQVHLPKTPMHGYPLNRSESAGLQERVKRAMVTNQKSKPKTTLQAHVDQQTEAIEEHQKRFSDDRVLQFILESIAKETGLDTSELTEDMVLTNLGIDSIMTIEIVALVKEVSDFDLLPSFIMECPTIGHLRRRFGPTRRSPELHDVPTQGQDNGIHETTPNDVIPDMDGSAVPSLESSGSSFVYVDTVSRTANSSRPSPFDTASLLVAPSQAKSIPDQVPSSNLEDNSPLPKTKVVLLYGRRPKPDQMRLYLMADGAGTISNYMPLLVHKYCMPIYGMDSPFLRCPSRLTPPIGISDVARLMVETLVEFQPEGPLILGGYSGGAVLAYEMCRQLAMTGRKVSGLLLLDMRCPLPPDTAAPEAPILPRELVWLLTQQAFTLDSGGAFNPDANTSRHLEALFSCVADYHPPPLPAGKSCPTAIIWCEKGMIGRLEQHPDLLQKALDHGLPSKAYPGYMEDPRLGHVAWGIIHKTKADMGPNGWERFVGGGEEDVDQNMLCLSVNADHHEIVQPTHAGQTAAAIEKALEFFLGRCKR